MQQTRFLDTRSTRPVGLIIVIAAHIAVLTAIALAPPDIVKVWKDKTFRLLPITEAPPPPNSLPQPRHEESRSTVTQTKPVIDIGTQPVTIELPRLGPVEPIYVKPIDPPKPNPVFVPAGMAPGAQANFQPDYPTRLIRAEVEGFATVRVLIGTDGRVHKVEMVNATDPAFFDATQTQALRYWRFKPATSDGTPTESWRTMTVRFKLQS